MIVEDEDVIRDTFTLGLTRAGYKVKAAASAEEALEILKKEKFWVFVLDLRLPGKNGIELCRLIRKDFPLAVTVAVTGYASLFELSDCREAGFDDYFTKPVSLDVLAKVVDASFEKLERWRNEDGK